MEGGYQFAVICQCANDEHVEANVDEEDDAHGDKVGQKAKQREFGLDPAPAEKKEWE
jgi:hypothetical protein